MRGIGLLRNIPRLSVVTVRVLALPVPAVAAHILERLFSSPAEKLTGLGRVCITFCDITCAAGSDLIRNGNAVCLFKCVDHIENAVTYARTEVEYLCALVRCRVIDRASMTACKVNDMDIVAYTSAVLGFVVIAENGKTFALANGYLRNKRHEVIRDTLRVFTDETGFMRTNGIEVTKKNDGEIGVSESCILKNDLEHIFCPAVRIGASANDRSFLDRHLVGSAVNGSGGAENDIVAIILLHGFEKCECGIDVVSVIFDRLLHGFANCFIACEMDDRFGLFSRKELFNGRLVRNVDLIEREILSDDGFDTVDRFGFTVGEIVCDDDIMTELRNFDGSMRTDVACAACKQDFHNNTPFLAQDAVQSINLHFHYIAFYTKKSTVCGYSLAIFFHLWYDISMNTNDREEFIMIKFDRYKDGKRYALTFSYDDGCAQDRRLVELFNKYEMKATFNFNSRQINDYNNRCIHAEEIRPLFIEKGHEIACHTVTHPHLERMLIKDQYDEIMRDREALEKATGTIIRGLAYPFGTYGAETFTAMDTASIVYGRTVQSHNGFTLPDDFKLWHPTTHHNECENAVKRFIYNVTKAPWRAGGVLYIWGHSYEFDNESAPVQWEKFEEILANLYQYRDGYWAATNLEIYDYVQAMKKIRRSADGKMLYNPTDIDVWVSYKDEPLKIGACQTVTVE